MTTKLNQSGASTSTTAANTSWTPSQTYLQYRQDSSTPLAHVDVDSNFELLRRLCNELVDDVTAIGTPLQSGANISTLTNDSGFTSNVGDITGVTAGTGLSGGGTSGSVTLSVDLSELTDMSAAMVGTDEFIVLDNSAERKKAASEIDISIFNNDSGFTSNVGDITGVTASTGLSGGGTSGTVTLSLANTTVTAGSYTNADITVDAQGRITAASNGSGGTGGITSLDYYDAKSIVPQTIVARVSATGISGYPLATSFTTEHTIGTGGVIFPAVTFPTMQMFQQYLRHHFGNKIWGDVIVRVDGTVTETLTESINCRNMIVQGWSGAPDTGSLAKAHLVFDCTSMVNNYVFFANHNQQSGNFFNLSNISVHVSGAKPLSVVKLEGGMYCQIDDTGFNFDAGCAPKYVTVAEGGSTLVFYKRLELNRNDGSPPTTDVGDNTTWNIQEPSALVYVENSKVEFYSPNLDPIVFNGLFTTAEVGDHGAIEFHPVQQVNGATNVAYQDLPTFWKIDSPQNIKGLTSTVPVFTYPDVGTERTANHPDINFYAGVNFTGGYGSVNIIDNHLIDIENTSQNLMGNFIVRHEDSAFSANATGSVGDVNKNYINTMEFNKQRSSDGTLTVPNFSGGNGEGTFASAAGTALIPRQYAHTNMNVFANGASQATPTTSFLILTA